MTEPIPSCPKIVVLDGATLNPGDLSWSSFEALGALTVYDYTAPEDVVTRLENATIALTNKTVMTEDIMAQLPMLRYIGALATGYNVIDVEAAAKHNIVVTNIPEYATFATAQMTIALLLELADLVGHHDALVHDGAWESSKYFCFWDGSLTELCGLTIGLFGFGKIARRVAVIADALGMKVLATRRTPPKDSDDIPNFVTLVSQEELFHQSDVLSFHCPLTPETQGLVRKETIAQMKDGVWLLNTSRGPVFQEEDVATALETGKIGGVGVDVLSREPADSSNPLLHAPHCIITPHIAWAPTKTRARLMETAKEIILAYLSGNPINMVF